MGQVRENKPPGLAGKMPGNDPAFFCAVQKHNRSHCATPNGVVFYQSGLFSKLFFSSMVGS